MSNRTVKIESLVNYSVVLSEPYSNFSRTFTKDMQSAVVDYAIMEQGLQLNGFNKMFTNGVLRIVDKKDRIDLGLEAASEDDQMEEIFTISTGEIVKLFKSKNYEKIEEAVNKSSDSTIQNMIITLIKFKLFDNTIVDILQKKAPSQDIFALIKLSKDAEKENFEAEL